jgi:hypothetical protein
MTQAYFSTPVIESMWLKHMVSNHQNNHLFPSGYARKLEIDASLKYLQQI